MRLSQKQLDKHFGHLEDHQYKHYNEAMGCMIYSKEHYVHEMEKRRMVPVDIGEDMARDWDKKNPQKKCEGLSPKAEEIIRALKMQSKNGYIVLGEYPKAVKALEELGMTFDQDKTNKITNTNR